MVKVLLCDLFCLVEKKLFVFDFCKKTTKNHGLFGRSCFAESRTRRSNSFVFVCFEKLLFLKKNKNFLFCFVHKQTDWNEKVENLHFGGSVIGSRVRKLDESQDPPYSADDSDDEHSQHSERYSPRSPFSDEHDLDHEHDGDVEMELDDDRDDDMMDDAI